MAQTIVVFEKRPRWEPELQRQLAGEDVRIRACRSTGDVDRILSESPGGIVVLDLQAGAAACLQFVARHGGRVPWTPVVVIGSSRTSDLEWPVRELGATEFLPEATGERLAAVCRRQWRNNAVAATLPLS